MVVLFLLDAFKQQYIIDKMKRDLKKYLLYSYQLQQGVSLFSPV